MTPTVTCVFSQTAPLGCDPQQLVRCLQQYIDAHVGPAWGVSCTLKVGSAPGPGWSLLFADDADQAGVLGYHEETAVGMPVGHVFVRTAAADDDPASVVASHELAEMLVDPAINLSASSPRHPMVAYEINDPVEDLTFDVAGLPVSNFVLPSWFGEPGGAPYDALGKLTRPWELTPGGYCLVSQGFGWSQLFGSETAAAAHAEKDKRMRRSRRRIRRDGAACHEPAAAGPARVLA